MFEKVNNILMYVLILIGVVLMIATMTSGLTPDDGECVDCWEASYFVGYSYVLLIGSIVAVLAGTIMKAISDPKSMIQSLIGVGAMVVIFGISYALADGTVLKEYGTSVTETSVRLSDAGLYMFYILFFLSIAAIVYSNISKLFK